ncbi:uncharacterized protein METZ01_LOCUS222846, partial [marine metagenome]
MNGKLSGEQMKIPDNLKEVREVKLTPSDLMLF